MSERKILINVQETLESTETATIEVEHGVEICRVKVTRKVSGGEPSQAVSEHVRCTRPSDDPHFGQFVVVEPELLERLRMTGWFSSDNKDFELISKTPFARVVSGEPYEIVRLKTHDHTLYALDGQRLPVGMRFDYMTGSGCVSDQCFDLPKLLEHLKTRSDVTLHPEPRSFGPDPLLWRIPEYNRESGYQHLTFMWHPDVTAFREYLELCGTRDRYERAAVAHTIMGNDAFRLPERDNSADEDED